MNFIAYYFFMVLGIVKSDILFPETGDNEFNSFLQNLILRNFNSSTHIGVFHDNKAIYDIDLPQILQSLSKPVTQHDLLTPEVVFNSTVIWIPRQTTIKTDANLIIIEESKDFQSILKVLFSIPFFTARSNALIILTGKVNGTEPWIRGIFSELWKIYIINVGLVFYNNGINLFTYIPWTFPHKIKNLTEEGIFAHVFYSKLKNLHKYPIKILRDDPDPRFITVDENNSTIHYGVDGMTMTTILQRHNATSNIIVSKLYNFTSTCRFVHYNGTIQGLFGADAANGSISFCPFSSRLPKHLRKPSELNLLYYDIDIHLNLRPLRSDMDYRVDSGNIQQWDSYCILIPTTNRIPQVVNLSKPLQRYLWLAVISNFLICTMIYLAIRPLNKNNERDFIQACLILYGIQTNNVPRSSKKSGALERGYLLAWVLYSFLISAAYQSVLISFITVPLYLAPIDRITELKDMNISIFVQPSILIDIPNAIDKETREILLPKVVPRFWNGSNKYDLERGYLLPKSYARYLLQQHHLKDKNGRPLLHLMNECPVPLFMTYLMPRGSFLLEIINRLTASIKEAGLDEIWRTVATHHLRNRSKFIRTALEGSAQIFPHKDHVRLTTAHLGDVFYILLMGHMAALISFLFEFFSKQISRIFIRV